jgi:hypothetical protein
VLRVSIVNIYLSRTLTPSLPKIAQFWFVASVRQNEPF